MLAYEQLKAAAGREVWFRPTRYEARKLFPHSPPKVRIGTHSYKLHDISLGGVAIVSNQSAEEMFEAGGIVTLSIQQAGLSIYEGHAQVCWMDQTVFGSKIALNFVDGFIDFDKLLDRNAQARIAMRALLLNADDTHLVPKEYRAFCADTLHVLRAYREVLEENISIAKEFDRDFDEAGAFEACESRLIQQWRSLWRTGNDIVAQVMNERELLTATKEYTELVLTPEIRLGSIWNRSYAKPLGYPGDFDVMNQVYDWEMVGENVYNKLLHRIGLEVAECIKTRMDVVRSTIVQTVNEKSNGRPARIMSLGSGPAREVELYLASPAARGKRVEFTLIDQEQLALRHAYEKTYPFVLGAKGMHRVQCLHMSFTDILRGTGSIENVVPQDLVYCIGLIDYLADKRAAALVARLYEALAPGGTLIIGNMNDTPLSNLWPMEFLTDWTLHYRSEADMLAWAKGLKVAKAWTETESTQRVRLMYLQKP